jgi:hypothetical protein
VNYYKALTEQLSDVELEPTETSYFNKPDIGLDPRLFRDGRLVPEVHNGIISALYNHLKLGYNEPDAWTRIYLAGSGVSYRWAAQRDPADLDCLISVDYIQFRQANQEYKHWSDKEIAAEINQGFRNELHPRSESFMGTFELTFYVNLNPDIEAIRPYAAYSVLDDSWVVPPSDEEAPFNPEWDQATLSDTEKASEIIKRYTIAMGQVKSAANDAMRLNAEVALANAVHQGSALYKDIHEYRKSAFSPSGQGFSDFANYRWQAGKKSGAINSLKKLHGMAEEASAKFSTATYGMELPDTDTLIRRSAIK